MGRPAACVACRSELQNRSWRSGAALIGPRQRELIRRWAAGNMVANTFDDDLDPSDGDPMNFGAGPVLKFKKGDIPALPWASQEIIVPPVPVYKPHTSYRAAGLELDAPNAQYGDMVAGAYGLDPSYPRAYPPDEDEAYARRDFMPSFASMPPPLPISPAPAPASASAFLVRMRRTRLWDVRDSFDDTPGISSAGPPLPYLFARGTPLHPATVQQGIAVRATAVAAAQDDISFDGGKASYSAGRARRRARPFSMRPISPGSRRLPWPVRFGVVLGRRSNSPLRPMARLSLRPTGRRGGRFCKPQPMSSVSASKSAAQMFRGATPARWRASPVRPCTAPKTSTRTVPVYDASGAVAPARLSSDSAICSGVGINRTES